MIRILVTNYAKIILASCKIHELGCITIHKKASTKLMIGGKP
jgi:hypothetical protein